MIYLPEKGKVCVTMKDIVVRKLDEIGRIIIPPDYRRLLNWNPNTEVAIVLEDGKLSLQAAQPNCVLCGDSNNYLLQHNGKYICGNCLKELNQKK